MNYWLLAILVVASYFIGNVNFGRILSRTQKVDITKVGSGNAGAANMFRNLGAKFGYLTLLLDSIKGVAAALMGYLLLASSFPDNRIGLYACGLAAVIGHIFPVFYKFKGGKGVSTAIGVFLVANPIVTLIVFVLAFIFVWFIKYTSVASMLIITSMILYENLTLPEPCLTISLLTLGIWVLTWFAHRANIERLLIGKENSINIRVKIFKDKKTQQKRDEKAEVTAEKIEIKHEKAEAKAEYKQEKKNIKQEYIQGRKEIKQTQKAKKKSKKKQKSKK